MKTGWPTDEQRLLITASCEHGPRALQAWSQWKAVTVIDQIDAAAFSLLGLLHKNLKSMDLDKDAPAQLRGVYRQNWAQNQFHFHYLTPLLKKFNQARVPVMLLKGAALILTCYGDYGVRNMIDVDLLVHRADVLKAHALLKELGWRSGRFSEATVAVRHSHNYSNESGGGIDLHWQLVKEQNAEWNEEDIWKTAVPFSNDQWTVLTPDPAYLLLHSCLHGARWEPMSTLRWVADSLHVLKTHSSSIDWKKLLDRINDMHVAFTAFQAFTYLHEHHTRLIPDSFLKALSEIPVSKTERAEARLRMKSPSYFTLPLLSRWYQFILYSPTSKQKGFFRRLSRFVTYVKHSDEIDGIWDWFKKKFQFHHPQLKPKRRAS